MIRQAIAGTAPAETEEVTVMTVWPSNAGHWLGAWLGKQYSIEWGWGVLTIGNLVALLSIPVALVVYFRRLGPMVATRYRLTNRRVIIERGMSAQEEKSVALDRFDTIEIDVKPGYAWYDAGDLVFMRHDENSRTDVESFRLVGVSRPNAFRETCLKSHMAFTGVQAALGRNPVTA